MRFARAFGTTPQFWLNLQMRYDLDMILQGGSNYEQIEPLRAEA
jgi:plasmid maintenance system antidote protein VapI